MAVLELGDAGETASLWTTFDPSLGTVVDPNAIAAAGMALAASGSTVASKPIVGTTDTLDGYSNLQSIGAMPSGMTKLRVRVQIITPPAVDPGSADAYFQLCVAPSATQTIDEGYQGGVARAYNSVNQASTISRMGEALSSSGNFATSSIYIELVVYFDPGTTTAAYCECITRDANTQTLVNLRGIASAGAYTDVFVGFTLSRTGTNTNDVPWVVGPFECAWE